MTFRKFLERCAAALIAAASVGLAAASDLAAGATGLQRTFLWLLVGVAVLLGIATYLVVDGLQDANKELVDEQDAQRRLLETLHQDLQDTVSRTRTEYVANRLQKKLRRSVTEALATASATVEGPLPSWRVGIWALDEGQWLLSPVIADDFLKHVVDAHWDNLAVNSLPVEIASRPGSAAVEQCVRVDVGSSSTYYFALQLAQPLLVREEEGESAESLANRFAGQLRISARSTNEALQKQRDICEELSELAAIVVMG